MGDAPDDVDRPRANPLAEVIVEQLRSLTREVRTGNDRTVDTLGRIERELEKHGKRISDLEREQAERRAAERAAAEARKDAIDTVRQQDALTGVLVTFPKLLGWAGGGVVVVIAIIELLVQLFR